MYRYELKPLPYTHNALEPHIDAETMKVHHGKHLQTYTDNLNRALDELPLLHSWPLEKILKHPEEVPESARTAVLNNAGGVYNHDFFFESMGPDPKPEPTGNLLKAVDKAFESFDGFKAALKAAAVGVFGSGWAWLVRHPKDGLKILPTFNQDTVLRQGVCPLLLVDVWEHAYYLKYRNKRADFFDNWFKVVDWEVVEKRYSETE